MTTKTTTPSRTRPPRIGNAPPTPDESSIESSARTSDLVDQWGRDSFPASDPPANW